MTRSPSRARAELAVTHTLPLAARLGNGAFGGMERHVLDLVESLAQRGVDVELLVLTAEHNDEVFARLETLRRLARVSVCWLEERRPLWTARKRFPLHAYALARAFHERRDRLMHLHVANTDLLQIPWARLLTRGVVVSQHSAMPEMRERFRRATMLFADRFVQRYVAVSDAVRRSLIDDIGIAATKIQVVDYGIPTFDSAADKDALRVALGLPRDRFVIGYLGRLVAMKNVDCLIDAAARLPELVLAVVGEGPERAALEQRARASGVGNVRFLGYRTDSREILRAFDLVALVSDWEGKPISLIEAMLAGVPVLGSAVAGTSEALLEGGCGLLVPRRDVDALVAALRDASRAPASLQPLVEKAREQATEKFSSARMTDDIMRVYESVQ